MEGDSRKNSSFEFFERDPHTLFGVTSHSGALHECLTSPIDAVVSQMSRLPELYHLRPTPIRTNCGASIGSVLCSDHQSLKSSSTGTSVSIGHSFSVSGSGLKKMSPTNCLLQRMAAEKQFRPHSPTDRDANVTPRSIIKLRLSHSASIDDISIE